MTPRPYQLAAAIVWYDEPLDSLRRCLESLQGVADALVIADGRWDGLDDDGPIESPLEQRQLVRELVADFEGIHLDAPPIPWPSQVNKRSTVYAIASELATWTLVIDADEHVTICDREQLRAELDSRDELTGHVAIRTVYGPQSSAGVNHAPRLFSSRAGTLRVENAHHGIRADDLWLTGDGAYVPLVPFFAVGPSLQLFHEQGANRPREREERDRRYRRRRRELGLEKWPVRAARA